METPSPTIGATSASTSGQREPVIVTPRHGPWRASTENVVPGRLGHVHRASGAADEQLVRTPPALDDRNVGQRVGAEGAKGGDGVIEAVAAAGNEDLAAGVASPRHDASASSVSVAALSAGWRSTGMLRRRPVEPGCG